MVKLDNNFGKTWEKFVKNFFKKNLTLREICGKIRRDPAGARHGFF